jgi:hypothetical protein
MHSICRADKMWRRFCLVMFDNAAGARRDTRAVVGAEPPTGGVHSIAGACIWSAAAKLPSYAQVFAFIFCIFLIYFLLIFV